MDVHNHVGSWILSAVALGLLSISFFVIRFWIEQQSKRISKVMEDMVKGFEDNIKERNRLKEMYLRQDMHKVICRETQATFMLHVSNEMNKAVTGLSKELKSNRQSAEALINQLRKDLSDNGSVKQ